MKLVYLFTAFTLMVTSVNANTRQDDDWESKTYDLSDFTEVFLEGGYKVYLIQGDKNSLTVRASDIDVFDYLKVKNDSESLSLKIDRKYFDFERVTLYLTFKNIEKINIEGGVRIKTRGYLDLNDFSVHVKGGAKIELNLKAEDVKVVAEGGVLFELNGVAESLDIHISGAGHIDASDLKTKDVTIKIEGVGAGNVYATETLYAKIEGVGKIKYRGNPKVTKNIDGLGSVTRD